MSDAQVPPPSPAEPPPKDHAKLIGRLIIIGFGLLLLVYVVPLALSFID